MRFLSLKQIRVFCRDCMLSAFAVPIVNHYYGGFWSLKDSLCNQWTAKKERFYYAYLEHYGAWIGFDAEFAATPTFPHGMMGVFISRKAKIGKNVTIFQQVTIGSVMTEGSHHKGSPTIEDNVYIGCGAKIIGRVNVGENARIGANCVIAKDVPSNSVSYVSSTETMVKTELMNNTFVSND
ncbi:MAG: serine acetyltransferase [Bacteroidales bacterium]|nr:serine acetyltransferase [Bacteroidales bacterium]